MTNPLSKILNGEDQNDQYNTLTNKQVGELDAMSNKSLESLSATDRANYDYASKNSGYKNESYKGTESNEVDPYEKYKDPKTGEVMSPQEYAVYLGNKVPGSVTKYAGDAMTDPDKTSEQLTGTATDLNNARNDIATGTTDPYKVGNKSGIAYSPAQLKAIESAYAGVYDPALNDVFARLKTKQAEDQQAQDRADTVFATNEAIRKYNATTGANKGTGTGTDDEPDTNPYGFSNTQLNKAAIVAGMDIADFRKLSDDAKNWYINPIETEKSATRKDSNGDPEMITMREAFEEDFEAVKNGEYSGEELENRILSGNLPNDLKVILVAQIPDQDPDTIKEPVFDKVTRIMNKITNGIDTSNNGSTSTIGGKSIFDIK